jgi:hypothetical protein
MPCRRQAGSTKLVQLIVLVSETRDRQEWYAGHHLLPCIPLVAKIHRPCLRSRQDLLIEGFSFPPTKSFSSQTERGGKEKGWGEYIIHFIFFPRTDNLIGHPPPLVLLNFGSVWKAFHRPRLN